MLQPVISVLLNSKELQRVIVQNSYCIVDCHYQSCQSRILTSGSDASAWEGLPIHMVRWQYSSFCSDSVEEKNKTKKTSAKHKIKSWFKSCSLFSRRIKHPLDNSAEITRWSIGMWTIKLLSIRWYKPIITSFKACCPVFPCKHRQEEQMG